MGIETATETDWVGAHIYYFGDMDEAIRRVVTPLRQSFEAGARVRTSFFLRYWDGGPHLRLRVLPVGADERDWVETTVVAAFTQWFRDRPATNSIDPTDYARVAPALAAAEGLLSYRRELSADNTIEFVPYHREHDRYGHGDCPAIVERHFGESSTIAQRILAGEPDRRTLLAGAQAMILLAWLSVFPDPVRLRRHLADVAVKPTAAPAELAAQMRALATQNATLEGTLPEWGHSIRRLVRDLRQEAAGGRLGGGLRGWEGPGAVRSGPHCDSAFVVADMCVHLLCNRLGVAPSAEAALRLSAIAAIDAMSCALTTEGGRR